MADGPTFMLVADGFQEPEGDWLAEIRLHCNLCGDESSIGEQITLNDMFDLVLAHSFNCPVNVAMSAARTAVVTSLVLDHAEGVTAILRDTGERLSRVVRTVLSEPQTTAADDVCNACGVYVAGGADPSVMSQHDCDGEEQ